MIFLGLTSVFFNFTKISYAFERFYDDRPLIFFSFVIFSLFLKFNILVGINQTGKVLLFFCRAGPRTNYINHFPPKRINHLTGQWGDPKNDQPYGLPQKDLPFNFRFCCFFCFPRRRQTQKQSYFTILKDVARFTTLCR